MERFGTVIIGGGIVGCAVAYYLTEEGESDVLVVEAEELGSGSTGGSFGGVRQQFSTPLEIEFSRRGLAFWQTAEGRFESPVPWHPNGYLFMTGRPDIMAKLAEAAALQRSMGLTEIHVLDPEQIREVVAAERVVVCTGYWTSDFLRSFGLDLSIRPQPLYSAITGAALAGQHVPLTLDLDTGFVVERESEGLINAILLEDNPP